VNIAVNLLQVQTSDGFHVLCDSVFSSCMDNGIASFVVSVLYEPGQQDDKLATAAKHIKRCSRSQHVIRNNTSGNSGHMEYVYFICRSHSKL
jgi:hypothetical protein